MVVALFKSDLLAVVSLAIRNIWLKLLLMVLFVSPQLLEFLANNFQNELRLTDSFLAGTDVALKAIYVPLCLSFWLILAGLSIDKPLGRLAIKASNPKVLAKFFILYSYLCIPSVTPSLLTHIY